MRWAMACGVAVVVIPLFVLVLAGLVVGLAAYLVFSLMARIGELFGRTSEPMPRDPGEGDGRVNVRVID